MRRYDYFKQIMFSFFDVAIQNSSEPLILVCYGSKFAQAMGKNFSQNALKDFVDIVLKIGDTDLSKPVFTLSD